MYICELTYLIRTEINESRDRLSTDELLLLHREAERVNSRFNEGYLTYNEAFDKLSDIKLRLVCGVGK